MAASSSKRLWGIMLTDPASEHEHRPTRRKLNNLVPSIVIDSSHSSGGGLHHADQDYQYGGGKFATSDTAATIGAGLEPSPYPDANMSRPSFHASTSPVPLSFPAVSNPLRMHGSPNDTLEIDLGYLDASPSLSPSGMQMLSLDSGSEIDLDSQTGGKLLIENRSVKIYP